MHPRLLVVDDNPLNQRLAERMLVKMNYCVDVVSNGKEALAAAQDRNYLAVLMDCQMPVMDGFDATRAIRLLPGTNGRVSIIAMTAFDTNENRQRCLDAGMDAFAAKPVDWSRVEVLLRDAVVSGSANAVTCESELILKQAWRDHVVLNLNVLARMIGDENVPDAIAELVGRFMTESSNLFDRLGLALASGDLALSYSVCTDLHGTMSSVGAERLAGLMSNIGELIRIGQTGDAIQSADRVWDELSLVLDELQERVVAARRSELVDAFNDVTLGDQLVGAVLTPWPAPSGQSCGASR